MTAPRYDTIVLGGGAAGLFCAFTAGQRGRRVLVLEHNAQVGAKILISGGGRCNFTNIGTAPDRFHSANPHFCKSTLARFTPGDFLALVQKHRIAWHEKTLGQLFCDGSARQIVAMLLAECAAAGADIRTGVAVRDVTRADMFRVETDGGDFLAHTVVLATGGLSIPKTGAAGTSYDIARRFGLPIVVTRPGLVPLTLVQPYPISGVSLPIVARIGRHSFQEAMLFTHRGLSGPAILQISSVWREDDAITIDLLPGQPADFLLARKRARPKASIRGLLHEFMPQRAADLFAPEGTAGDTTDKILTALGVTLKSWNVTPSGTEGYAKAEVTLGGIDTAALSSRTMESKTVPGLFAIGECVDVTGWLGGYNFQWAWASGHSAGLAV